MTNARVEINLMTKKQKIAPLWNDSFIELV